MATMSYGYQELYNKVSKFLGTYGSSGPSGDDLTDAKAIVKRGYMRFLTAYDWTFRRRYTTLTTESGKQIYELPSDFGGFRNSGKPLRYSSSTGYPPIEERSEAEIQELDSYGDYNSYPQFCAIRAGHYDPQGGQRYELMFWPIPTTEHILYYSYYYMPPMMSNDNDIPMGGAEVAEAILQSCLCAAEEEQDEEQGVQSSAYIRELSNAINRDKEREPRQLGYAGNAYSINPWEAARGSTRINNVTFTT